MRKFLEFADDLRQMLKDHAMLLKSQARVNEKLAKEIGNLKSTTQDLSTLFIASAHKDSYSPITLSVGDKRTSVTVDCRTERFLDEKDASEIVVIDKEFDVDVRHTHITNLTAAEKKVFDRFGYIVEQKV